ncbi:MAG: hypothetical protein VB075_03140 [Petrimonas sp.]|uniref:hypothetical protein n=1 Tax=Petrimonas sp. TaxID=2023866 RepID=UPI001BD5112D|nr:hypothetical protein [Petrimonas sp.]MEA4949563.1 hypothetical protein [Petrimonas sp.]MEA4979859.1 hypothetical protein [Petrimonas sp.]MEA5043563.1 hypothetical protein [Petrimonas sp.]
MKKNITLLCFTLIISISTSTALAQTRRMNMADYEKRKMEYIQKEAGLTKEEADRYFPLYNDLSKKKFELHKQHRDKVEEMKQNNKNMSNEEYRQLLENDVDVKLKEAELDKQYSEKMEKILSPEKLYRAQQAERKFMQQEVMKFRGN